MGGKGMGKATRSKFLSKSKTKSWKAPGKCKGYPIDLGGGVAIAPQQRKKNVVASGFNH